MVAGMRLLEEPFDVLPEDGRNLHPYFRRRLPRSIDNATQRCFVHTD